MGCGFLKDTNKKAITPHSGMIKFGSGSIAILSFISFCMNMIKIAALSRNDSDNILKIEFLFKPSFRFFADLYAAANSIADMPAGKRESFVVSPLDIADMPAKVDNRPKAIATFAPQNRFFILTSY